MTDARILATDGQFRIVKAVDGEKVTYTLEKHDGFDALGVERWKGINDSIGNTGVTRQLFNWVLGHALQCPQMKAGEHEPQQSE